MRTLKPKQLTTNAKFYTVISYITMSLIINPAALLVLCFLVTITTLILHSDTPNADNKI